MIPCDNWGTSIYGNLHIPFSPTVLGNYMEYQHFHMFYYESYVPYLTFGNFAKSLGQRKPVRRFSTWHRSLSRSLTTRKKRCRDGPRRWAWSLLRCTLLLYYGIDLTRVYIDILIDYIVNIMYYIYIYIVYIYTYIYILYFTYIYIYFTYIYIHIYVCIVYICVYIYI